MAPSGSGDTADCGSPSASVLKRSGYVCPAAPEGGAREEEGEGRKGSPTGPISAHRCLLSLKMYSKANINAGSFFGVWIALLKKDIDPLMPWFRGTDPVK